MNADKMKELIPEGMTFINKYNHETININIQYTDAVDLGDIMTEFREFLLGCGFSKVGVDKYLEDA